MSHGSNTRVEAAGAKPAPQTIGFRLDELSRQVLCDRSSRLGVSPHELARYYVTELLADRDERRALRDAVSALHEEITLRKDIIFATEALLTSAGKVEEKAARSWVKKNFHVED